MDSRPHPMQATPGVADTPEAKLHRRRVRRWKRRARIAGPFVGVTILLAALSLSVDLIEYQPRKSPDRLSVRPMRSNTRPTYARLSSTHSIAVPSPESSKPDGSTRVDADLRGLDLSLSTTHVARPPTPPEALR